MLAIIKIALRNLYRQKRRTYLTVSIVAFGVVAVLLFTAVADSFKTMMIGQITDSALGHLQIHKKGYVSALESAPLDKTLNENQIKKLQGILDGIPEIEAYSLRLALGGMFSNYAETTNIRVIGIDPDKEQAVSPLLKSRVLEGKFLQRGEILVPDALAKGFESKVGDGVVLIATNVDGSVNGQAFTISGMVESVSGAGSRYGYIHLDDALTLLRMESRQVSEIAIRLKRISDLERVAARLRSELEPVVNKSGQPMFEVHTWKQLSPFFNIARMIDLMALFIQVILIAIVLISILNVMVMAVYERVREIGTIAAIGTLPGKIRALFFCEGLSLGVIGATVGSLVSIAAILAIKYAHLTFAFGRQDRILLNPNVSGMQILITAAIVIGVTIIAVVEPAYKASKLEPIEALRHS
ncbi:ABC-type lipoprotein release transporter, permease component [Candidatus Vecturithrix granuli]|uniref:ABC-type lipoprotein release transporter, permease component n=1 Tax=Vecturithrix granuli TaxID=1499967 RepID=A0A081BWJ7_VECG1|nr:ABC-type lipoprotein release transporter, permease component [Candidatus Vecturithrix granuli]